MWIVGDSQLVLPTFENNSFDFVLADPPYVDHDLINFTVAEGRRVSRGAVLTFMYAEDLCHLTIQPDQIVFWVKPISTKNTLKRYSRFVEVIAVWHGSYFAGDVHWSAKAGVFTDRPEKHEHPWRKPRSLIETLIRNHAPPGSHILDPFAGSGVVAEVATYLGMTTTSIELNPRWKK